MGNAKTTEHVHRGKNDGCAPDGLGCQFGAGRHERVEQSITRSREGSDNGYPRQRIHARHERGVQQTWDILDDEISHDRAHHEHNNEYDR